MPPSAGEDTAPERLEGEQMRCPTCRALQKWSDTCRRCRSDLRLLRELNDAYQQTRRACLARLRAGEFRAALRLAEQGHALSASANSTRLRAVCALLAGDWPTAASLARHGSSE